MPSKLIPGSGLPLARDDPPTASERAISGKDKDISHDLDKPIGPLLTARLATGGEMAEAAVQAVALSAVDKELVALAIDVSTDCDGRCDVNALVRLGAREDRSTKTLAGAYSWAADPSLMYAADKLCASEQFSATALSRQRQVEER